MIANAPTPSIIVQPPRQSFLTGHLPSFRKDPLQFVQRAVNSGGVVQVRLGPVTAFVISNPDLIQQVLVKQADKFTKSRMLRRATSDLLGNGLLTSEGTHHGQQRKLIQPAFHHQRIAAYGNTMVEYTLGMLNEWEARTTSYIDQDMNYLTMLIVGKTLFGQDDIDDAEAISSAISQRLNMFGSASARSSIIPPLLNPFARRKQQQAREVLLTSIDEIINRRLKEGVDQGDLLSMLLLSEDENGRRMSAEQVRDEAITLFVAGHETTANALAWTFYLLAQHPEVEEKLLTELDYVLGSKPPSTKDLPNLRYTEMVIKESMRLFPPAWIFGRVAQQDVSLGSLFVREGQTVVISPYAMGRSERFFDTPLVFDPERFSPERESTLSKYAYLPFGAGPRVCIGNGFAMMEAKLLLATIVQRFHIALLQQPEEIHPEPMITLRPSPYIRARIVSRRHF